MLVIDTIDYCDIPVTSQLFLTPSPLNGDDDSLAIDVPDEEEQVKKVAPCKPDGPLSQDAVDPFLARILLSPDRAYVAQWDAQIEAFCRDTK